MSKADIGSSLNFWFESDIIDFMPFCDEFYLKLEQWSDALESKSFAILFMFLELELAWGDWLSLSEFKLPGFVSLIAELILLFIYALIFMIETAN